MATKKKKKKRRQPSRVRPIHPLVVAAGLADHSSFVDIKEGDSIDASTVQWLKARYSEDCRACGLTWWHTKRQTPVCLGCWTRLPVAPRRWWWSSKRTKKSLRRFLDAYFPDRPEVAA